MIYNLVFLHLHLSSHFSFLLLGEKRNLSIHSHVLSLDGSDSVSTRVEFNVIVSFGLCSPQTTHIK